MAMILAFTNTSLPAALARIGGGGPWQRARWCGAAVIRFGPDPSTSSIPAVSQPAKASLNPAKATYFITYYQMYQTFEIELFAYHQGLGGAHYNHPRGL
jgi:hypothetical protein